MIAGRSGPGADGLRAEDIVVRHDPAGPPAVDHVGLSVAPGEVLALLGPSGSGKSSLLRALAGLEPLGAGSVSVDGTDLTTVAAHRRGIGLMFQDYALFPHRNVEQNVAFGLRMGGRSPADTEHRLREVLDLVGLAGLARRSVSSLSGGEQQRVALARALAPAPRVLLLDEPLGALDRDLRQRLLMELEALLGRLDIAVVYVTHDQEEALSLGDRVAVMRAGAIVQEGPPAQLWSRPATAFVARFLGLGAVVGLSFVDGRATAPWGGGTVTGAVPGDALLVRPDAVVVVDGGPGPHDVVAGTVLARHFSGGGHDLWIRTAFADLPARVGPGRPPPAPGDEVVIRIDTARVRVVAGDDDG